MHLARMGRNVLLIDLDLEAPGLASLVFEGDERPPFGVLDYLVENGLGGVSDGDLVNFVGTSRLTDREEGGGRVDLVPATGTLTLQYPENMLEKYRVPFWKTRPPMARRDHSQVKFGSL